MGERKYTIHDTYIGQSIRLYAVYKIKLYLHVHERSAGPTITIVIQASPHLPSVAIDIQTGSPTVVPLAPGTSPSADSAPCAWAVCDNVSWPSATCGCSSS